MRVLIADDDPMSCHLVATLLAKWGYEPIYARDGKAALDVLTGPSRPKLAILDWMMPHVDGIEVCRRLQGLESHQPTYTILLTSRDSKEDVIHGLEAGADDYLTKPFNENELQARIRAGQRVVQLRASLAFRIAELEQAMAKIKVLSGLLPICSRCKKVRDDKGYWNQIETYIRDHSEAEFTHGLCPDCEHAICEELGLDP